MNEPQFHRRPLRLVDEIASELRRMVRAPAQREGDKLPTEKELCDRFGVSRTVVREAVAQLKTESLVDVRHGSGLYVAKAEAAIFRMTSNSGRLDHFRHVYELRRGVEIAGAGLAAERRNDADLQRLDGALAAMVDPSTRVMADIDFHLAVATATRNPHYESFVAFLGNAVASAIEGAVLNTMERHRAAQAKVIVEHDRIVRAIRAGDARRAERAMGAHLGAAMVRLSLGADLLRTDHPGSRASSD